MNGSASSETARERSRTASSTSGKTQASPQFPTITRASTDISRDGDRQVEQSSPDVAVDRSRQRFVLTDPIAFRYLEEDPSTSVLDRRRELIGYECYVVEQWATSRTHPTFVITTFTGNADHKVVVGVLSVPTNEAAWSQRLRVYFKALNQYHAKRRDTPLGIMMVTNLSGFPSSLSVIAVPDGDLRKHRFDFFVNENLKRLGCSGRVGLAVAQPNAATVAKFHQLYRTSDKIPLYSSVIELVKLCQAALNVFDVLEIDYADGLLCDVTEKAITDWWIGIGAEIYNIEPHDGILGPTTVSALLGLLMGARNRLHSVGAPVPKDPFDIELMKRGISYFQKNQHINRTRRLDRQTLRRLHKISEKAASSEGWRLTGVIKSTVAELSGKGGEMHADAVGRRDRAGIADIETCDMERFDQLLFGSRSRWLWHAKPLKKADSNPMATAPQEGRNLVFKNDDHGGYSWTARKPTLGGAALAKQLEAADSKNGALVKETDEFDKDDPAFRRSMMNKASSGLGRIKGAVSIRGHNRMVSKDDMPLSPIIDNESTHSSERRPTLQRSQTSPSSPTSSTKKEPKPLRPTPPRTATYRTPQGFTPTSAAKTATTPAHSDTSLILPESREGKSIREQSTDGMSRISTMRTISDAGTAGTASIAEYNDYNGMLPLVDLLPNNPARDIGPLLRRTQSYSAFVTDTLQHPSPKKPARHLSFSIAEYGSSALADAIHTPDDEAMAQASLQRQYNYEMAVAGQLRHLRASIAAVDRNDAAWSHEQLRSLMGLHAQADRDQELLQRLYYEPRAASGALGEAADAMFRQEKEGLQEGAQELETLTAKLEYEMGTLRSKIADVEIGVRDFEHAVRGVEERVGELEGESQRPAWCAGWAGCVVS